MTYAPVDDGPIVLGGGPATVNIFDAWMYHMMKRYALRCGSLAIVKDQKLVFARSYKWAEPDYRNPKQTDMYRIGSISKWITGIAAMRAIGRNLLELNTNVRDFLGNSFRRLDGSTPSAEQYDKLTVDHLLRHVGGWRVEDNGAGTDFFNQHLQSIRPFYKKAGKPLTWPAQPNEILRYVASLDRDAFVNKTRMPGDFFAYSAVDTQLLMHVSTRATGRLQQRFVDQLRAMRQLLFEPLGITRFSPIRGVNQVRDPGFEIQAHVPDPDVAQDDYTIDRPWLPYQYVGNWDQGPAAGGWLMSAVDLARVLAALDTASEDLLDLVTQLQLLWAPPPAGKRPLNDAAGNTRRHAFYWGRFPVRRRTGGILNFSPLGDVVAHNGKIGGGDSLAFIRRDGLAMVVLFNGNLVAGTDQNGNLAGVLDAEKVPSPDSVQHPALGPGHAFELNGLANKISSAAWPTRDLFPDFGLPKVKVRTGIGPIVPK